MERNEQILAILRILFCNNVHAENPMRRLALASLRWPPVRDYYRGQVAGRAGGIPDNLLAFTRRNPEELVFMDRSLSYHHRFVWVMPLQCSGVAVVDGRAHALRPHCGILIFPHQFHQFLHFTGPHSFLIFITFEASPGKLWECLRNRSMALSQEELALLSAFSEDYACGWEESARATIARARLALWIELMAMRAPKTDERKHPDGASDPAWSLVTSIQHVAERNPGIKVKELAVEIGSSESSLRRTFRETMGNEIGAHLFSFRMSRALGTMLRTQNSLGEIALDCGYESQASFSRAFRGKFGVSPREYRRKLTLRKA